MSPPIYVRLVPRRFWSEDWKSLYDYQGDQTEPSTFTSGLVSGEYTEKTEWKHLLKVAWEDPIAHRICVVLSKNVFDDWFVIKEKGEPEDGEERKVHEKNNKIQEELERMNTKFHLTQALIGTRIFGHSAQVFNYNKHKADVHTDGYNVGTLDVFTDENMTIPAEAFDEDGVPEYIRVWPDARRLDGSANDIPWKDVLWWCINPKGRSWFGYSSLYAVWDLMTYLRESIDAMVWSHKKYGLGVFMWYVQSLDQQLYDKIEGALKDISARRSLVVESDDVDRVEWQGPNVSGTTAIVEGAEFTLGLISSGSGIPKDIFTGVSAGAITGSEINNKALYATISKIQSEVTPYVLETIRRMDYDITDMEIEWNTRYATDEMEQATIKNLLADAKIKEAQAERGTDFQIGFGPTGQPADPNKQQNPTGRQG